MAGRFCDNCQSLLSPGSERCPKCGRPSGGVRAPASKPRGAAEDVPRPWEGTPVDRGGHPLFPYRPRPSQLEVVEAIGASLAEGKHLVMESGTGTGKTICSLVGALEHAREHKKKVLYLTRTISQSDQVMKELRSISRRTKVTGIPLLGRRKSCLLLRTLEEYEDVPPHALSKICEERKQRTMARQKGGCPFFADYLAIGEMSFAHHCMSELPTADEFDRYCQKQGACPYEARKAILPLVDVIVVPYVHLLSKEIRSALFDRLKLTPDDFVLIVDEAHNLIDAARDQESFTITMHDVEAAELEARDHANPRVMTGVDLGSLCATLRSIIDDAAREQVPPDSSEARLGRRFLEGRLRGALGLSEEELRSLCANLMDMGDKFVEERMERGKEPVSATLRLGTLLESWISADDSRFVKLISVDSNGKLVANCVEPEETTAFLSQVKGAVHMSGTLHPLRQYADVLGLPPGSELRSFPSPFPPGNRLVVYPEDVSAGQREMRMDPSMKGRIAGHIIDLCNATDRNTMVFFRSYEMLRSMRGGIEEKVDRQLYWEESGSSRRLASNIQAFKKEKDGVFFTVMGGKVAEGLDFPGQELDIAIVVGIPYPPPSLMLDELKVRYDKKYGSGKGWEYTSAAPAVRKVQQAIGRLIRTETDRGAAVILDNRVSRYREQLGARPTKDPVKDVVGFLGWSKRF
ncbi:helicase C-terminal domain-containing protein [Methanomassiliicoccus luminyensis]|uniref:helicase C-terminal domain-containing protein n=1 Tax=Methanomassiliicoccus luminyensis TaxID=1080712 RepID=UPI00138AF0D0|nr:helicase C-terminal domain-containing protein [Methanomassiliicoccus luminyensis]